MPINQESLNRKLEKALKRYDVKPVNNKDEVIPLADEADAFRFNFTKDGENYGTVYATLDDTHSLTVWFDDEVKDSPDAKTPGVDYDDTFTGLLNFLKRWAMNNQLSFNTDNRQHLGREMARRKHMKDKEKIAEGYYPMGKKASYNDAVPNVKIVLQHSKVMQEGEQRFRHIEKIFVENAQGERFLVPTTKPGLARVFARHIAEGGTPYDERAGHIQSLVEEYNKMAGFVRATRNGQFNESAQQLVNEGINHYLSLRESLSKMTGRRGYTAYFENWTPALMEDDTDSSAINELFVQETMDPRIESVMPILSRLHKQVAEMKEVSELDEWASELISEKMVMGADSDASSAGTVFVEEEGLQSKNPAGIPEEGQEDDLDESGLQAYLGNKKYGKEGMDALRKAGRDHASKEKMASIRAKYDKLDEIEMEEGLGDIAKKVGGALKKAGSKAIDVLGGPDDDELLRRLQKSAGVPSHAQHGKPSMAKPNESVEEDLDANQKRAGQLGPTGGPAKVGDLVGANESVEIKEGMMKHFFAILDDNLIDQISQMNGAEVDPDAGTVETWNENTAKQLMAFAKKNPNRLQQKQSMVGMRPMAQPVGGTASGPDYNLNEMDSPGPYDDPYAKGGKATPMTADKAKKDFAKMFQKNIDKANKAKQDTDKKVKQHQVKEGQEDLDAILRIIKK